MPVQVKAIATGNWQLDVSSFVDVRLEADRQILGSDARDRASDLNWLCMRKEDRNGAGMLTALSRDGNVGESARRTGNRPHRD